jgi:hypothetical protein
LVIIQLSLSQFTVKSLQSINTNQSQAVEWLVRYFQGQGFPTPFYPKDKGLRVVLSVNISPYALDILKSFMAYGLNPSKTVDWLVKIYTNGININEPKEPKKVKKPKQIEVKQQQAYPEKEPFVHVYNTGPIVKKVKVKLTRG